jgi:hypothetical protein
MATVEQRLERLEKSQKRYRFATIGLLCLLVAGVSMGQTSSDIVDVLRCRKLEVYNSVDTVTVHIWNGLRDGGNMVIKDKDNLGSIYIGSGIGGGPDIALYDDKRRLSARITTENGGSLDVYNKTGDRFSFKSTK